MTSTCFVLAYVGPETIMPVASVLAAIVGFLLMMGRTALRYAVRPFRVFRRGERQAHSESADQPAAKDRSHAATASN